VKAYRKSGIHARNCIGQSLGKPGDALGSYSPGEIHAMLSIGGGYKGFKILCKTQSHVLFEVFQVFQIFSNAGSKRLDLACPKND